VVRKIRQAWPEVGILLRGDSYYACPAVYDFCEEFDMKYVLGLRPLPPLVREIKPFIEDVSQRFTQERRPLKMFTETDYKANSWPMARRVIAKVEHNALGPNTRFIITNLEHWNRRFIYQTVNPAGERWNL
jgi:hypothetical protein